MRKRYVAAWRAGGLSLMQRERLRALANADTALELLIDRPSIVVLAERMLPVVHCGEGIVLGPLFEHGRAQRVVDLRADEIAAIENSGGACLMRTYWGSYVSFLPQADDNAVHIVRAPLGDLGCYRTTDDGGTLIASDAALLCDMLDHRPTIDWDALARHLGRGDVVGTETCLTGISELRGGDRLTIGGTSAVRDTLWSPWRFAAAAAPAPDAQELAWRVRDAVRSSVASLASSYDRVILLLSGGLDSSIVAACLARSSTAFDCLNLVSHDAAGDEREYARLAARGASARLHEAARDTAGVDFHRSLAAMLPRPGARAFNQESERQAASFAGQMSAQVVFDGGGGDNLFCSHRSVAATADCLLTDGFGMRYRATAAALGDLTQAGQVRVLLKSIQRAWLMPASTRAVCDITFLSAAAADVARARLQHPWLVAPVGTLPGRAVHVALLAAAQSLVESSYTPKGYPRVSPLVTQPVAEACLQVPSWLWFAPGRDRAAARQAFAGDLPAKIVERRSKGTPAAFAARLIEVHRPVLRSLLLDGRLAAAGMIDMDAVRAFLDDPAPSKGFAFTRLLQLADAEAWARCWD